jgi:hypothetical protein
LSASWFIRGYEELRVLEILREVCAFRLAEQELQQETITGANGQVAMLQSQQETSWEIATVQVTLRIPRRWSQRLQQAGQLASNLDGKGDD